jgi:outer membrane protein insertion porin family
MQTLCINKAVYPVIRFNFMKRTALATLLFAALISSTAAAPLKGIRIEGNQRIESETIHSYLPIKVGEEFLPNQLDESLKALHATGYFTDVHVSNDNDTMVVKVEENPIINRIAYEGNSKLKDDVIQQEIKFRPREVLSRARIQEAQQRVLEIYRRMGRFGARVEPKIIKLPENRVDLIFEIDEGAVTYVRKITFIGNKHIPSKKLEEQLNSKRTRWYRFFAVDDVYDPDRFMADQQALRKFYYDNGYPDFRIITAHAELSPDQKDFFFTFHV